MPFLRAYSPGLKDHYYTVDPVELVHHEAGGYADQGVAGLVFRDSTDSTVPLYRLYNADKGEHYYTTSVEEADQGYENEGTVAYVYETQICGSIPLYYVRNEQEADNLYTVFEAERDVAIQNLGYEDKGVACYVLP
ncbi:hypothetical protein FOMPIDRAFT_1133204 [Fomitopsis schrenkii]|uniref:DUF5648 domain-containing protein n=1 Tax=Fomitopsis schrenkii TaxID=2126942 RepID=S8DNU2_FOMSC|nr:hypothetical protein FOMPIDRAFT_1133204 [Fomitopsis schrenkii]